MASLSPFPGVAPEDKAQARSSRTLTGFPPLAARRSSVPSGPSEEEEGHCVGCGLGSGAALGTALSPCPLAVPWWCCAAR